MNKDTFVREFENWMKKWHDFLKEKTINEISGRAMYIIGLDLPCMHIGRLCSLRSCSPAEFRCASSRIAK